MLRFTEQEKEIQVINSLAQQEPEPKWRIVAAATAPTPLRLISNYHRSEEIFFIEKITVAEEVCVNFYNFHPF